MKPYPWVFLIVLSSFKLHLVRKNIKECNLLPKYQNLISPPRHSSIPFNPCIDAKHNIQILQVLNLYSTTYFIPSGRVLHNVPPYKPFYTFFSKLVIWAAGKVGNITLNKATFLPRKPPNFCTQCHQIFVHNWPDYFRIILRVTGDLTDRTPSF